jgi:hypothetical protein
MRLTNEMNFPHPVLAEWRNDYENGKFAVEISYQENKSNNQLMLHIATTLDHGEIESLIDDGGAQLGCFVTCVSTGYRRLIEIGRPSHTYMFKPGDLIDSVVVRPIVWATKQIAEWTPSDVHQEFFGGHDIQVGSILAMAEERAIQVGRADLPSLETIFCLEVDDTLSEGQFSVDMGAQKITILAPRKTYDLIEQLRGSGSTSASVVMNAVYVPVVMRVLSQVSTDEGDGNFAEFEGKRWVSAFQKRCDKLEIKHRESEILRNAQQLLEFPITQLAAITGEP